ncbi:MAG: type II secretion system F family protein [Planctomycetes bacterium]|nr:type II secretion system F family protein [Planctomycetota bacterium]MCG2682483.1 type II secretion system F family protein [Planctomycetales bacterium]
MPTYQFEAMDATGQEIKDVIEATNQDEAQATIRQMGYFVTKISVKKSRKTAAGKKGDRKGKSFAIGGVKSKTLTTFTRQLSILQDAGLPILRSLKILEQQATPGALKNSLIDVCDEIEGGATLSEAMAKSPKAFNRLYVNMIKAGEAGGALEVILKRLAEFQERSESLKRKVKGALVYPITVVVFACSILVFIMMWIVPRFTKIFLDFDTTLPDITVVLIFLSNFVINFWYLLPGIPLSIWLVLKLIRKFSGGRMGWHMFIIKMPVFGPLIEKNIIARTMRTLGTLVASGVPILEALHITKETSDNAVFERLFQKVYESIREGESIAKPLKENSKPPFHPMALFFWFFWPPVIGALLYLTKMNKRVIDDMVVNMVDVGEETGELDTMLYKVADTYDEEVAVITESLMSLMEPLLIIVLGFMVGFIVIALFMPLIKLITDLS